jgi:hypothetical protein
MRAAMEERHLKCPRCGSDETRRTRNYGRPVGDEQWCTKCQHRWDPAKDAALARADCLRCMAETMLNDADIDGSWIYTKNGEDRPQEEIDRTIAAARALAAEWNAEADRLAPETKGERRRVR